MNKKIILILALAFSTFLVIACVSAAGLFDILSNGSDDQNTEDVLVVGFNSAFPPFGYKDANGDYTGFDIELAKEVCKRNNWTFKAQPIIDWNSKKIELDGGEIDCIWSEFTINGREDEYTWSEPYFNSTQVVIVRSDSDIDSLKDLKGKTVEIQQSSSVLKAIEEDESINGTFEVNQIDIYDTAMMDLETGVCDAVIGDSGIANYLVAEKYRFAKILDQPVTEEQYGIGFKKGNEELRDQVQKTLNEMFEDGTVDKIAQNYSEYRIPEGLIYP